MARNRANAGGSSDQSRFARIESAEIPRSSFDRSHLHKSTLDAGYLVPILVDEVLPGDVFNVNLTAFVRLATPIKPVMDNLYFDTFFFFCPYRILWDNFAKMMGEQDNPGDSIDYVIPHMSVRPSIGDPLLDYMGLPTIDENSLPISVLPLRAYNKIFNIWFRHQDLQNSVPEFTDDGPNAGGGEVPTDYKLLRRNKRHDYFTSCLPYPQKGQTGVTIGIGDKARILGFGVGENASTVADITAYETPPVDGVPEGPKTYAHSYSTAVPGPGASAYLEADGADGNPQVFADLSQASLISINDLRESFQIQRLLERDARGGTRLEEINRVHFGVVNPDARLQRPEYLGGGSSPIVVHPIAQTSSTDPTSPQGNLSAMGTGVVRGHGFSKGFTEHGVIIGLANVRADLSYQQGLRRMWSRRTRFDHYWPALAHLGEQAVLSKEIYATGREGPDLDDKVWGYQERWAELRYFPSLVTGRFRSEPANGAASLDVWHLSQDFALRPELNEAFMQEDPPVDRVIAVKDEPHILMDAYFKMRCARPMPVYSTPGLIDHF